MIVVMSLQEFKDDDSEGERKRLFFKIGLPLLLTGIALCIICFSLMPREYLTPGWEGVIDPFWSVFGIGSILILLLGVCFIILRYHKGGWDEADIPV